MKPSNDKLLKMKSKAIKTYLIFKLFLSETLFTAVFTSPESILTIFNDIFIGSINILIKIFQTKLIKQIEK